MILVRLNCLLSEPGFTGLGVGGYLYAIVQDEELPFAKEHWHTNLLS